jgi:hypothetical protein
MRSRDISRMQRNAGVKLTNSILEGAVTAVKAFILKHLKISNSHEVKIMHVHNLRQESVLTPIKPFLATKSMIVVISH